MPTALLQHRLWERLTTAVMGARGKADVAVAYFGSDGGTLLPLRAGSRLVVDASESAVRSGQTHPEALLKLYRRGVAIYSKPGLHAKVFLVGWQGLRGLSEREQAQCAPVDRGGYGHGCAGHPEEGTCIH